ncbi:hypothetical protein [Corticimicrobacter populi]|uniref:hypothetical protein n=1 Tax=Corticimicrobacter populi TaxID=2175229 RepID=UPI0011B1F0B3|nr:hypothetical protein [Corticimicrobacter populi]
MDFNSLIDKDLVLLSKDDEIEDSSGQKIMLWVGRPVAIYEYNHYENGEKEYLLAEGFAVLNDFQKYPISKWCCRINLNGIDVLIT